ncbi:MAG: competence/damage-inducible protein A [Fimbriimonadales bacterium]
MPSAEIIAIGTEILLGDIVDTNSQALGKALAECGIVHKRRSTVGARLERAVATIRESLSRSDIVFTIGGLGPTVDDITRDAIATAVEEPLECDTEALAELKSYVKSRSGMWRAVYERQVLRPVNAVCIPNESGTAPGIHWQENGKHVIAMPGPRNEFLAMLEKSVRPILASLSGSVIHSRTLRILGIPESALDERFAQEMLQENPTLSPYAKVGEVHLRITAKARNVSEAESLISPLMQSIKSKLGDAVYSDNNHDLAKVIVDKLTTANSSLAIAESCTGGMLGARITSVPGASHVFLGGILSYSDSVKADMLNASSQDLNEFGAVSEQVARQLATNVRSKFGSTYGLAITGIAGPGGGSETKPVGLVYVAVATQENTTVEEHRFRGGREHIREISVQRALAVLYTEITAS